MRRPILALVAAALFALGLWHVSRAGRSDDTQGADDRATSSDSDPPDVATLAGRAQRSEGSGPPAGRASGIPPPPPPPTPPSAEETPKERRKLTVLDWKGKPAVGARILVRERKEMDTWDEDAQGHPVGPSKRYVYGGGRGAKARTDSQGVALVRPRDPGPPWHLVVEPGLDVDALPLVLDDWDPQQDVVRLPRTYRIAGVVRDRAGAPAPEVDLARRVGDGWVDVKVYDDATFDVGGLPPGPMVFRATIAGAIAPPDAPTVTLEAGNEKAVIEIDAGADLELVVDGFPESPQGVAYVTPEASPPVDGLSGGLRAELSTKGRARVRGLRREAAYAVWVVPIEGRGAYRRGVRVSDSPLHVRLESDAKITCRLFAPSGARLPPWGDEEIDVEAAWLTGPGVRWKGGTSVDDQEFVFEGVPEGTWKIRVNAARADGVLVGEATAEAGASTEVRLRVVAKKEEK